MRRADTPDGLYVVGNPVTGEKGTRAGEFYNDVQEEICNAIEAAGIVIDPAKRDQLADALLAFRSMPLLFRAVPVNATQHQVALCFANVRISNASFSTTHSIQAFRRNSGALPEAITIYEWVNGSRVVNSDLRLLQADYDMNAVNHVDATNASGSRFSFDVDFSKVADGFDFGTAVATELFFSPNVYQYANAASLMSTAQLAPLLERLRTGKHIDWLAVTSSSLAGYLIPTGANTIEYPAAGNYQSEAQGAVRQMVAQLHARYEHADYIVVNRGVAGACILDHVMGGQGNAYTPSLDALLKIYTPDVLIYNVNSNDLNYGRTPAQFEAYAYEIARTIKRWGGQAIVVPPLAQRDFAAGSDYAKYRQAMYRACADYGIPVARLENVLLNATGTALVHTYDGTHPDIEGASLLGRAFAQCFPDPSDLQSLATGGAGTLKGDWTQPRVFGGYFEWLSPTAEIRRSHVTPADSTDGYTSAIADAPGNLMRPNAVAFSLFAEGAGSSVANGAKLSPDFSMFTVGHSWGAYGLSINTGNVLRMPLDSRQRLKVATGRDCFTASIVFRITADATVTILGRRGVSAVSTDIPFSVARVSGSAAQLLLFPANSGVGGGAPLAINSWHALTITTRGPMIDANFASGDPYANTKTRTKVYLNGALLGSVDTDTARALVGDDLDWTIGGRWNDAGMTTVSGSGPIDVAAVSISRDHYVTAEEETIWYAAIKAWAAGRGIALP